MTTRETIIRYHIIINKLRKSPASFAEIKEELKTQSTVRDYDFDISIRTFKRDCKDILAIYNINIIYHFSRKNYYIEYEEADESKHRMMEAFDLIDTFSINKKITDKVYFEKRQRQGTQNMYDIINAINTNACISFAYQKYWEDGITIRNIEPYALKEFRYRWYIIAKDLKDDRIKTFALDRLSDIEISSHVFENPQYDVNALFKYSFGIINYDNSEVEDIILSFTPRQGKYIKSLPFHESQEIIVDNDKEMRIKLKLCITFDLEQEILSMADNVVVIAPESLKMSIKNAGQNIAALY